MEEDLVLTVSKETFDLIESRIKKRDYRQVTPHWTKRLNKKYDRVIVVSNDSNENDPISLTFPYNGYVLTQISPHEISYDRAQHILNIAEPEFVYAIKLDDNRISQSKLGVE